jgi:hypothetical protein
MLNVYINKNKDSACISEYAFFDQNNSLGTNLEYIDGYNNATYSCKKLNLK